MSEIGILRVGQVSSDIVNRVQEDLNVIFTNAKCTVLVEDLSMPVETFSKPRKQYRSDIILSVISKYAEKNTHARVLGIVDVDIFVPRLSFVFGQAEYPGKAALISLWRLRPEFYKNHSDDQLFAERSTKEAAHELGHTFGLKHCSNPFCVMYFSNSIFETDRKQSLFCNKCYLKAQTVLGRLR